MTPKAPLVRPRRGDLRPAAPNKSLTVSWSSGLYDEYANTKYSGPFIDSNVDSDLDGAAEAAGWPLVKLEHKDGFREHWGVPMPHRIYVLIVDVPFKEDAAGIELRKFVGRLCWSQVAEFGIGAKWDQQSCLGIPILLHGLLQYGFHKWLPLIVSSTQTEDLIRALLTHDSVLSAVQQQTGQHVEFYDYPLPLSVGERVQRHSKQKEGESRQVHPIATAHRPLDDTKHLKWFITQHAPSNVATIAERAYPDIVTFARSFEQSRPQTDA